MGEARVALVFLYGCDLNTPLKWHLDNVARVGNLWKIKHYILCGGMTQQSRFPGLTEARTAYNYLLNSVPSGSTFYLEEESFTTLENARNGAKKIRNLGFEVSEVFVFVEAMRALKARIHCSHFLSEFFPGSERNIRFETESWERMKPGKILFSTFYDWMSLGFPPLAWCFKIYRRIRARFI